MYRVAEISIEVSKHQSARTACCKANSLKEATGSSSQLLFGDLLPPICFEKEFNRMPVLAYCTFMLENNITITKSSKPGPQFPLMTVFVCLCHFDNAPGNPGIILLFTGNIYFSTEQDFFQNTFILIFITFLFYYFFCDGSEHPPEWTDVCSDTEKKTNIKMWLEVFPFYSALYFYSTRFQREMLSTQLHLSESWSYF